MTRKIDDNPDKAFTHEPLQSLSSKTTSARITKNEYYLVLASCAYFLCMLVVLVFSGVFIFQKVLAPAISNLADAPVENKEDTNLSTTIISDEDSMILLYVEAGDFIMGDVTEEHTVNLDAFWIDQTEVTNIMYSMCVNDGVCNLPYATDSNTRASYYGNPEFDKYPVIYVSWEDANNYCNWAGRRLPTEAEWEKAASWDNVRHKKHIYPWGNNVDCSLANYWNPAGGCVGDTTEVGSYESGKSPYGVYDMGGNVGEWVSSLYVPYPYDKDDGRERDSSSASDLRIVRGGAWYFPSNYMQTTYRSAPNYSLSNFSYGFRCALSASE